jgi:hypothetical protein
MDNVTTPVSSQAPKYDARSVVALGLCVGSLLFDLLGWPMAIVGVALLARSVFPARIKWILAALALAPKVLFLAVRTLAAPQGLSFVLEPRTLATSSSLWTISLVIAAFGVFMLLETRRKPVEPGALPPPESRKPLVFGAIGLAAVGGAAVLLLGLTDGFHRIEEAGNGQWALKHAARGTVATFAADEVELVEATVSRGGRGGPTYHVRIALTGGRSFSVSTTSASPIAEVRAFATTANLKPGTVRTTGRREGAWTNGAAGFTLKDFAGAWERADAATGDHVTLEFWIERDRLAGKETVVNGPRKYVRALRNIRAADTGEIQYDMATRAEVGKPSDSTVSFSWNWAPGGESGRLTKDGLSVGVDTFKKR